MHSKKFRYANSNSKSIDSSCVSKTAVYKKL